METFDIDAPLPYHEAQAVYAVAHAFGYLSSKEWSLGKILSMCAYMGDRLLEMDAERAEEAEAE